MKQHDTSWGEWNPPPQPLAGPGEQRPQHFQDEDEADAFSRWLAHVEAGRIGPPNPSAAPEVP